MPDALRLHVLPADDVVLHVGAEVGAGGEGADGEEPLQHPHEAAGLLQHVGLHHRGADGLEHIQNAAKNFNKSSNSERRERKDSERVFFAL